MLKVFYEIIIKNKSQISEITRLSFLDKPRAEECYNELVTKEANELFEIAMYSQDENLKTALIKKGESMLDNNAPAFELDGWSKYIASYS